MDILQKEDLLLYEELSRGGYGYVIRAEDKTNGKELAIKCFQRGGDSLKLQREAEKMKGLRHPSILCILGLVKDDDMQFVGVAMDYMAGGCIPDAKERIKKANKTLPGVLMNRWTYEIAVGIQFIHYNGIVHKDIKAKNCLIDAHLHAKLCDFELCRGRRCGAQTVELQREPRATLTHQPPECITNIHKTMDFDTKCDIYSLGITMFEVYSVRENSEPYPKEFMESDARLNRAVETGTRPDISEITKVAPPSVITLMRGCWDANPGDRPKATDVVDAMRSVHNEQAERQADDEAFSLTPFVSMKKSTDKGIPYAEARQRFIHDGPFKTQGGIPKVEVNIQHGDQDNRLWTHLTVEEANEQLDLRRNKINLGTMEDQVVSKDSLAHLGKQIGPKDFKLLGSCLLFEDPELDSLHHDHSRLGIAEVNTRMLMQWRENNDTDATYKWMATACLSLNRFDLIDTLCKA